LPLEPFRVPDFADELAKALNEEAFAVAVVFGQEEKVAKLRHARERLDNHVDVGGVLEVVETDRARNELRPVDPARILDLIINLRISVCTSVPVSK
jgi:hypothetical protein